MDGLKGDQLSVPSGSLLNRIFRASYILPILPSRSAHKEKIILAMIH